MEKLQAACTLGWSHRSSRPLQWGGAILVWNLGFNLLGGKCSSRDSGLVRVPVSSFYSFSPNKTLCYSPFKLSTNLNFHGHGTNDPIFSQTKEKSCNSKTPSLNIYIYMAICIMLSFFKTRCL